MKHKKSPEQIEDEKELALLHAKVNNVMSSQDGRDVIWHILGFAGIYVDTFSGNSHTFYNEGKRAYGLEIMGLLEEANPHHYPKLILENLKKMGVEDE